MYCRKLFEALDKRLEEKKTLDEIGNELCDTVEDSRGKAIRLVKAHKGEKWLEENAEWLGYQASHIKKGLSSKKFDDGTNAIIDNENKRQIIEQHAQTIKEIAERYKPNTPDDKVKFVLIPLDLAVDDNYIKIFIKILDKPGQIARDD